MSVVVKGMEMPMTCNECPLGEYEDSEWFRCSPLNTAYRHMTQCDRLDDCPLVELPEKQGKWLRMSDLSEKDDNRYKCSRCGNVIHYKSRMDLYTFNSWCGRCGSDNRRCTDSD